MKKSSLFILFSLMAFAMVLTSCDLLSGKITGGGITPGIPKEDPNVIIVNSNISQSTT